MYFYVYDSFLNHKKYDKILADIEARLIQIGINGKIHRLSVLTNIKGTIQDAIRHGAKTVVVVGNDQTFSQAANTVIHLSKGILGFIPIGTREENLIAEHLSIPIGVAACDALSARIIERIPLGCINNQYFLLWVRILSGDVDLFCDEKYHLSLSHSRNSIQIYNSPFSPIRHKTQNNFLYTIVDTTKSGFFSAWNKDSSTATFLPHKKIRVTAPESVPVLIDDYLSMNTPVSIEVAPEKLSLIVGKGYHLKNEIEPTVEGSSTLS